MEWWFWLLIALGIALVIGLIIFLVIRATRNPAESVTIATTTTPVSPLASVEKLPEAAAPSAIGQLQDLMAQNAYQRMIDQGYVPETAAALAQLGR